MLNAIQAHADRRGSPIVASDLTEGVALMLSASWGFAKMTHVDAAYAKSAYVVLLRSFANGIESLP